MNTKEKIELIRALCSYLLKDPSLGEYKLGHLLNINHATAGNYKRVLLQRGVTSEQVITLKDDEIAELFSFDTVKKDFIEPDWEEIRLYLDKARCWAHKLPTISSAWRSRYVDMLFPNYKFGPLPDKCMSERTFMRRYNQYLDDHGLQHSRHKPNASCNFGPASVMEIDTIGDKLPFIDKSGVTHDVVIFTATLKYSGYIYAEAMTANQGFNWANAIINACWYFGGTPEVLRSDNDSAICIHGNQQKQTRTCLRPVIALVIRELNLTHDFCPPKAPRWRGQNERTNEDLEQNLLIKELGSEPLLAENIDELNELIRTDLIRLNSRMRAKGQLSRLSVFKQYEQPLLNPLPLIRPVARLMSIKRVRTDGYVSYHQKYYYAGADRRCTNIYLENRMGKRIILRDSVKFTSIAEYEVDQNLVSPNRYYKAEKFKTEIESIISRDLIWFQHEVEKFGKQYEGLLRVMGWVYDKIPRSKAVASRICNYIYTQCQKYPDDLDVINMACLDLISRQQVTDVQGTFHTTFQALLRVKKTLGRTPTFASSCERDNPITELRQNSIEDSLTRGADYYEKLLSK